MIKIKDEYLKNRLKLTLTVFSVFIFCISCSSDKLKLSSEFVEFNTAIKFTAYQIDPAEKAATESLFYRGGELLNSINLQLDPDLEGSEVENINRSAFTRTTYITPVLQSLIQKAYKITALTDSSFDVAVYPLFNLWGFSLDKEPSCPDSAELSKLTALVTSRNVKLFNDSIRLLTPQVKLGFGAIAKGWAADSVAAFFKSNGLQEFIIAAAGDIVINSSTKKTIAVRHPRNDALFLDTVYIDRGAISTSGDYERFFEANGRRFCHIINPRTGYPDSDCLSVSVITDAGWKSDALATGIFVMGRQKGSEFMKKNNISGIISYLNSQKEVERLEINLAKYKNK